MVSVIRPGQRILPIPGIGVTASRRAVRAGGGGVDWSQWFTHFWLFKGASSQSASYVDVIANLTMTTPAAPSWNGATGLTCNGSTQYMDIGFIPATYMTVMLQFTGAATGTGGETSLIGHYKTTGSRFQLGKAGSLDQVVYAYGDFITVAPMISAGNLAVTGTNSASIGYRDGIAEIGSPGGFSVAASQTLLLGARRREDISSIDLYTAFTAVALGIRTTQLDASQMLAAATAMTAL